jgi:hypothetical protein
VAGTVASVSDSQYEGSQAVSLVLIDATNGLILGGQSTATLWILDAAL